MEIRKVTFDDIRQIVSLWPKDLKYYGVPRGGSTIAAMTGNPVDNPEEADAICDDIIDSGATRSRYQERYPDKPFFAVVNSLDLGSETPTIPGIAGVWYSFPWEKEGHGETEDHALRIIQAFDDPNREGLTETPKRYIKFLREFLSPPEVNYTQFDAESTDQMVVVHDIPFYSLCEHHLVPFFGKAHVAYLPGEKIVGISKLARTVQYYARRFQNQERITRQVAERLMMELKPLGVGVIMEAEHLCMTMRGANVPGTKTTTSSLQGNFREGDVRREFLNLIIRK